MSTLNQVNGWILNIRPILDAPYFLAAFTIAVFAWKVLEQLNLSKDIARKNAQREAFKLAAEQCRYYAEHVLPAVNELHRVVASKGLKSFGGHVFEVIDGEIIKHNFSMGTMGQEISIIVGPIVDIFNNLEAFSTYFVSGVAEESVAYRETGINFCDVLNKYGRSSTLCVLTTNPDSRAQLGSTKYGTQGSRRKRYLRPEKPLRSRWKKLIRP